MSFFAVNEHIIALCGRHHVHVHPQSSLFRLPHMPTMVSIDLRRHMPDDSKAIPDKLSAVGVDVSKCGKFIVAADSGKNVFMFEFTSHSWELFSSFQMPKRLTRVQFDRSDTYIIMTDKTGDVYLSHRGPKTLSDPKRILGHTSYILDVALTRDNKTIITCDRDEKVRISKFPAAYEVIGYRLGHKEPVVSVSVVNHDNHLVSVAANGEFTLWRFMDQKAMRSWNIFDIVHAERTEENEVVRMRVNEYQGKVYIAFTISGLKELQVLQLFCSERSLRIFGRTRLENDFNDFKWAGACMYVFSPDVYSVKKYIISEHGLLCDQSFTVSGLHGVRKDLRAFAEYHKPFLPVKKRISNEFESATLYNRSESTTSTYDPQSLLLPIHIVHHEPGLPVETSETSSHEQFPTTSAKVARLHPRQP